MFRWQLQNMYYDNVASSPHELYWIIRWALSCRSGQIVEVSLSKGTYWTGLLRGGLSNFVSITVGDGQEVAFRTLIVIISYRMLSYSLKLLLYLVVLSFRFAKNSLVVLKLWVLLCGIRSKTAAVIFLRLLLNFQFYWSWCYFSSSFTRYRY